MHRDVIFIVVPAWPTIAAVIVAAALASALLIVLLMPLMRRYAMARPTARGLHTTPTPQGGGLAIMLAVLLVCLGAWAWSGAPAAAPAPALTLLAGASVLAGLGALDDIRPLSAKARLAIQFAVAAALVWATPARFVFSHGGAAILFWLIFACVGLVWFVNLTNFMDGMDGMTVVGLGVPALFAALAHLFGHGDAAIGFVCLAAVGGLIGFFPFNAPKARLFLGDVGSLSLGLIVGVAFLALAGSGAVVAALIAPLYYLADSTITLFLRWRRGENLAQAHRSHFYQRAVTGGMSAWGVLARVGALNVALAALAWVALVVGPLWQGVALLAAAVLVGATLRRLARGK